jgi:HK97 family phage prohead protease
MPEQMKSEISRLMKSGLRFEIKDAAKGLVEAVFATFKVKDLHNDWTLPGAFEEGAQVLISAYNHKSWWDGIPVGKGVIRTDEKRAILVGEFNLNTEAGREHFEMVKFTGDLQEWSYGFDVMKTGEVTEELRQIGVVRVLEKLKVYEVSPVMLGAGIETETLSVKGKGNPEPPKVPAIDQSIIGRELARFEKTRTSLLR